jgi:hypothetical protein
MTGFEAEVKGPNQAAAPVLPVAGCCRDVVVIAAAASKVKLGRGRWLGSTSGSVLIGTGGR